MDVVVAYAVDRLSRNQNHIGVLFDEVERALSHSRVLYDCAVVRGLAERGVAIEYADIGRLPWVEIDFHEDLEHARSLARR